MKEKMEQKKKNIMVPILLFITVTAVLVAVWALFFQKEDVVLAPDYAPEQEEFAEEIPGDNDEQQESSEGGGRVSLTYSNQVAIDLHEKTADLLFANPGKSNQNMVLQIVIQDNVVVQSGTLVPGNQVKKLDLLDGAVQKLSEGGYDGKFVVLYYNPDSGEKAIVNTEIPIHITVNK